MDMEERAGIQDLSASCPPLKTDRPSPCQRRTIAPCPEVARSWLSGYSATGGRHLRGEWAEACMILRMGVWAPISER